MYHDLVGYLFQNNPSFCSPAYHKGEKTLTTFLGGVLSKRYTNMSSDVILILAGLDHVDTIFSELVASLDTTIRSGRSCKWGNKIYVNQPAKIYIQSKFAKKQSRLLYP
jgi:hypothetical protein